MERKAVYEAFDSEREYQLRRWGVRQEDGSFQEIPKSIEEYVLYMEDYLDEARTQLSRMAEPQARTAALDTLRKVVTLGIACFEQHGVEPRVTGLVVNGRDGHFA